LFFSHFKRGLAGKWLSFKYNNKSRLKEQRVGMVRFGDWRKTTTHVMARDNFIIHSKKYFSFAMPSTPASISISAYG